jgi:hypothetical protein
MFTFYLIIWYNTVAMELTEKIDFVEVIGYFKGIYHPLEVLGD